MSSFPLVLLGIGLLLLGRKLFWFFVGAAGFLAGWALASRAVPPDQGSLILILAAAAGVIGILLALFLQKVAVLVGGFLAGGFAVTSGLAVLGASLPGPAFLPFLVGGLIGALLARLVFDWGLIVLSSVAGAVVLVEALEVKAPAGTLLAIVLAVAGCVLQWRMGRGKKKDS